MSRGGTQLDTVCSCMSCGTNMLSSVAVRGSVPIPLPNEVTVIEPDFA